MYLYNKIVDVKGEAMQLARITFVCSILLLTLLTWIASLSAAQHLYAQESELIDWNEWDVIPGRLIVEFTTERSIRIKTQAADSTLPGLILTPIEQSVEESLDTTDVPQPFISLLPNTFVGEFDPADLDQVITSLANDPDVVYFEPDRVRIGSTSWGTANPNDPFLGNLWGMDRINAPVSWARQPQQRRNVRVAVMEERFFAGHVDLANQAIAATNSNEPISDHATHVAGTIAATGNNGQGVVGVANVELVALDWGGSSSAFAQSVSWARNNQVRVINMSWGYCIDDNNDGVCDRLCDYPTPSETERQAIRNALNDIVFVGAAGNDSCNVDAQGSRPIPVSYEGVIGVSALTMSDTLAGFSNFGSYVDLTAPGVNIWSTVPRIDANGQRVSAYASMQGTSMAAPHVAGSAAAILAINPTYDSRSLDRLLLLTAEDIGNSGRDDQFGLGVVRTDRAVAGLADIYLESASSCSNEGTLSEPFCQLDSAINAVPTGGRLGIVRGSSFSLDSTWTISKPITIVAVGGAVTIGP